MASKSGAFLSMFLCVLAATVAKAQDDEDQWFWIMADSLNSSAACPGRCLAVNDTGAGDYNDKPVVFVACRGDDSTQSSTANNNNQRWLRASNPNSNTTIQFNATAATDDPSAGLLCLQPNPATKNRTLKLAACDKRRHQQWIVANNSIATLAFDPPQYLAMNYTLAGFLNASDGPLGWRHATISPSSRSNASFTATFSMVEGTQDLAPALPVRSNESPLSHNFVINGDYNQSSYDFPNSTATLTVNPSDPFSLCNWQVMKGSATLGPNPNPNPNPNPASLEGNPSLLLKDAVVKQTVATTPSAFYTLVLKVAIAKPDTSSDGSTSNDCNGNDTLSVNPYPSSNVHQDVEVSNGTWTIQHVSFQALGTTMQLAFQGCATCGCYLDDVNLMQIIDSAPFPPPPLRPPPPGIATPFPPEPFHIPPDEVRDWRHLHSHSNRLSNEAVVGIVVGTAASFFLIGAACFWVVVANKQKAARGNEIGMGRPRDRSGRPREWSIQTTSPAQSQAGVKGNSSATVPTALSASAASAAAGGVSGTSPRSTTTTSPALSSNNPLTDRGA